MSPNHCGHYVSDVLSIATRIFALACGVLCLQSQDSRAAGVELKKVWSLETKTGAPVVVQNQLGKGDLPPFPLESLIIRECKRPESGNGPDDVFHAVLNVSTSGIPTNELNYAPVQLISHGSFGDEKTVFFGSSRSHLTKVGNDICQTARVRVDDVRGLERSPRGNLGVLLEQYSTQLIQLDSGTSSLSIPHHVYEVAYARSADIGALLTLHLNDGETHFTGNEKSQIVVFDFSGKILYESPLSLPGHPYQQLYVNPNGTWLMATQRGSDYSTIATDYVTLFDVKSGEAAQLPGLSGGLRYHSLDGKFMALVQTGWGRVYYYDMSVPDRPTKLWTWEHSPLVASAAVNADGSLLALVAGADSRDEDDELVVLNRAGDVVASQAKSRDATQGLIFAGDYLFVGIQASLVPAYVWQQATHKIDLYYVGALH